MQYLHKMKMFESQSIVVDFFVNFILKWVNLTSNIIPKLQFHRQNMCWSFSNSLQNFILITFQRYDIFSHIFCLPSYIMQQRNEVQSNKYTVRATNKFSTKWSYYCDNYSCRNLFRDQIINFAQNPVNNCMMCLLLSLPTDASWMFVITFTWPLVRFLVVCFCWALVSDFFARHKIWWIIRRMWCAWMVIVNHPQYFGYYFCLSFYSISNGLGPLSLVELRVWIIISADCFRIVQYFIHFNQLGFGSNFANYWAGISAIDLFYLFCCPVTIRRLVWQAVTKFSVWRIQ